MDLYYYAQTLKDDELANASLNKAKELINTNDCSHSSCSRSSCSECSNDEDYLNEDNNVRQWNNQNTNIPPLPITSKVQQLPQNYLTYTPPLPVPKITRSHIPPFPNVKPIATPRIPNSVQNTRMFSQNISITNTNFIKPRIEFNPMNQYSYSLRQNYTYDQNLRIRTTYATPKLQGSLAHVLRPLTMNNNMSATQAKEIVHRTISFNIPPPPSVTNTVKRISNGPYMVSSNLHSVPKLNLPSQSTSGLNKNTGEKNVKFSDTVTAFIVPVSIIYSYIQSVPCHLMLHGHVL